MTLIQTKDSRVVRDTDTRALLSTNLGELYRVRRVRVTTKKVQSRQAELTDVFTSINCRLDRCESMLLELAQHISMLVSKYPSPSSERE